MTDEKDLKRGPLVDMDIGAIQPLIIFSLAVTIASVVLYFVDLPNRQIFELLKVTSRTMPYGLFTGIFVHVDLSHLVINMIGLWTMVFIALPVFGSISLDKDRTKKRVWLLIVAALAAGIISNALWFALPHKQEGSAGASGLIYGIIGTVMTMSLMNIMHVAASHAQKRITKRFFLYHVLFNAGIAGLFVIPAYVDTNTFLSAASQVNVLAHGIGFMAGLAFVVAFEYVPFMLRTIRNSVMWHPWGKT